MVRRDKTGESDGQVAGGGGDENVGKSWGLR